jgi:hypothetical protein
VKKNRDGNKPDGINRRIAISVLMLIIVFGTAGCSLMGRDVSLVIKNESSVTVMVEVLEGGGLKEWSGNLPPGASETRNGNFNSFGFPGSPAWDVNYTVNGKTGRKYGSYYGAGNDIGTCTITQADVDGLR